MQGMVKLMEGLQLMQSQILDVKKNKDVEIVKSSVAELPRLQEWRSDTAPLDLTDWLLTIEPAMGDLSDGSQQWWEAILASAKHWYLEHQEKTPLEKVNHKPEVPDYLQGPKFQRLEKRATTLLMQAIPHQQQEEVIAAKEVTTMGVLSRLMLCYQPGGLSEKGAILTAVDSPEEATGLTQAVLGMRKWLRWHRRAGEVGVVRPDSTILVKGLGRLLRKVLKDNPDFAFRVQLAKSSLAIDTAPTDLSVMHYANHVLAELEQIAHQDRKKKEDQKTGAEPKAKRLAEEGEKAEGKGGFKGGEKGERPLCRFFNTDEGCRKGKSCTWVHSAEGEKKRCYNCGSVSHFSPGCDRPKESSKDSGEKGGKTEGKGSFRPNSKALKKEEGATKAEESAAEGSKEEQSSSTETMKGLLEEANKMPKGLSIRSADSEEKSKSEKLAAMQSQLDELRKMKVLRLSRVMKTEKKYGLLDSGATHPMRGRRKDEDTFEMDDVNVILADGHQVAMKMTKSGVMIVEDKENDVEPIVPLGLLTGSMGYAAEWRDGHMKLTSPSGREVKVIVRNGCPQILRHEALKMIKEIEERQAIAKGLQADPEELWLRELVKVHPVLKLLPKHVKDALVVKPAEDLKSLPGCNRRRRKILQEKGFAVHLYAGEEGGYDLSRALKEAGGDRRRLVEIDLKRQKEGGKNRENHNMLDNLGPYRSLLRGALDGNLLAVIAGPNCRTRSVLRHYPLPIPGGGPRPVRSWEEPWGKSTNTKEEQRQVEEDDILMWRSLMLFIVSEEIRKAMKGQGGKKTKLGLEQPADPTSYMPEVVPLWLTAEWTMLRRMYFLGEQTFRQSDWGGKAVKPTTFGGNLILKLPHGEGKVEKEEVEKVKSSKDLERWAPGMMREVAMQLQRQVFEEAVRAARMSWEEHIQRGHTPFRRDCQICQEASARRRMHKKITHAKAGVLNLDVSGPYLKGNDVEGDAKFMLVGTYTWLRGSDECEDQEKDEVEVEEIRPGEEEELPAIEDEAGEAGEEPEEIQEGEEERLGAPVADALQELGEVEEPKIEVIRVGVPVKGKTKEAVLSGVIDIYLQLKADGFPVHTIHTDRGREFCNQKFKAWMRNRGVLHSTNAGEDPQANGRAERAVQEVKRMVRRLLHSSEMEVK